MRLTERVQKGISSGEFNKVRRFNLNSEDELKRYNQLLEDCKARDVKFETVQDWHEINGISSPIGTQIAVLLKLEEEQEK